MSQKHKEKHIIRPVYLSQNKLVKVVFYLKPINKTFSRWVRDKIDELISGQKL